MDLFADQLVDLLFHIEKLPICLDYGIKEGITPHTKRGMNEMTSVNHTIETLVQSLETQEKNKKDQLAASCENVIERLKSETLSDLHLKALVGDINRLSQELLFIQGELHSYETVKFQMGI